MPSQATRPPLVGMPAVWLRGNYLAEASYRRPCQSAVLPHVLPPPRGVIRRKDRT